METEKRLVDINKVINSMQKCLDESPDKKYTVAYFAFESIIATLKKEPTADAVEVVRCNGCKHFVWDEFDGAYVCIRINRYVKKDFFCAYGERKADSV